MKLQTEKEYFGHIFLEEKMYTARIILKPGCSAEIKFTTNEELKEFEDIFIPRIYGALSDTGEHMTILEGYIRKTRSWPMLHLQEYTITTDYVIFGEYFKDNKINNLFVYSNELDNFLGGNIIGHKIEKIIKVEAPIKKVINETVTSDLKITFMARLGFCFGNEINMKQINSMEIEFKKHINIEKAIAYIFSIETFISYILQMECFIEEVFYKNSEKEKNMEYNTTNSIYMKYKNSLQRIQESKMLLAKII
jgi:hypothetical protein